MPTADQMIALAQLELGKPYVFGDEGPETFDCSGLVQFVLGQLGIKAPRIAAAQQDWATRVATPRPGDLVFFGDPAHHVGIYIGAGKMINAPHRNAVVRIDDLKGRNVTNYGRVPGLGGVAGAVASGVGWLTGAVTGTVGGVLSGARHILIEGLAYVAGAGVLIAGVWLLARDRTTTREA